jgi:rod shape-determining protein MreB
MLERLLSLLNFNNDIGIDLGTATVLVYVKGKGIVLEEPSVVAVNTITRQLEAVGEDAQRMLGRTPGNIVAVRPLKEGVISDYGMTERMIRYFLNKVTEKKIFKPRVVVCVPSGVTEVEERAVIDASTQAGASKTYIIEEPIAAAIGAGIDIAKPNGHMIVDIGGGTTDVAVISLGGTVVSNSLKVAGDKFDDAIIKYIKKKHNVLIGERTAEDLKKTIGSVYKRTYVDMDDGRPDSMEIRGRCLVTGLPKIITVTDDEMYDAFEEPSQAIVDGVKNVLEQTPPELISDIIENGILMTGGGSLVWGLDKLISQETGIDCRVAADPISCVALGTGKALSEIDNLQANKSRPKYV